MKTIAFFLLLAFSAPGQTASQAGDPVRKALDSVPGYGVFDYLTYRLDSGGKLTLLGAVTNPGLKLQAEKAVRGLPGISAVDDRIETLPPSDDDDAVRKAVYKAVYGGPAPSIYEPAKAIHIIVRDKAVTLEGTVKSDIDRTMIAAGAAGAGDVIGVTDHLVSTAEDSPDAQWRRNMDATAKSAPPLDLGSAGGQ